MDDAFDTIVVGAGAMGLATAWALARRGRHVLVVEQFAPGHTSGASHGETRNFNVAYRDPVYQRMLREADSLWEELGDAGGEPLIDRVGLVNHGAGVPDDLAASVSAAGWATEVLSPEEAEDRWGGIRFDTGVVHFPQAGRVRARAALDAMTAAVCGLGGSVSFGERMVSWAADSADSVVVETDAATHRARHLVLTVGAWTTGVARGRLPLPRLVVTQEQPAHFGAVGGEDAHAWPSFNHQRRPGDARYDYWYSDVYGMLTPGEGVKAGWHGVGPECDPDARTFEPEPRQLEALTRYAADWLPGADPHAFDAISCTYTTTPDEDFVVDSAGPVSVGAGFSGHGFKFTPVIGRMLADLATGEGEREARFAGARTSSPRPS